MDEFDVANEYLDAGDGDRAMPIFRKLADQGRVAAMSSIGHTYLHGVGGVPQDYDQAFEWFTRAADNGCPQAMYHLGLCNAKGYGTPVDPALALQWYEKSAARGDEDAMYEVGVCHECGSGTVADKEAARGWYRKAADRGQEEAAERLKTL